MKTLKDLKPGDKVILIKHSGQRDTRVVRAAFGSLVDIGLHNSAYHFEMESGNAFRGGAEKIIPATPELVSEVEAENAKREQAALDERARVLADPRTPLVNRFKYGECEPWDKLTLEQLQQIADMLTPSKGEAK